MEWLAVIFVSSALVLSVIFGFVFFLIDTMVEKEEDNEKDHC